MSAPDRAELRTRMLAWRGALPGDEVRRRSARASRLLCDLAEFAAARSVMGYMAVRGELDPMHAMSEVVTRGRHLALPALGEGCLDPRPWAPGEPLEANRYGIGEPIASTRGAHTPDLVIVPAVALDACGRRLGMGGGWYDRTFRSATRPLLVGFVHDEQLVDRIPTEEWDVPVDVVVTPTRTIRCGSSDGGPAPT